MIVSLPGIISSRRRTMEAITWTRNTGGTNPFGTNFLSAVNYGNSFWVIGGGLGVLGTASDPASTWTLRTSSFGTSYIASVEYDGTTNWVACGDAGKIAYTGSDPTTGWTQNTGGTNPFTSGMDVNDAVFGDDGYWVAVGGDNASTNYIATATDPSGTWTIRHTNVGQNTWVDQGNGQWACAGALNKIIVATDPTGTWTEYANPFGVGVSLYGITYSNLVWMVVGFDGFDNYLATASDPAGVWTVQTLPAEWAGPLNTNASAHNGLWVICKNNDDGKIATSLDGITWIMSTSGSTAFLNEVEHGNGIWVCVGSDGEVLTGIEN